MARPLTEEGDGAPSLRPLWMLMPYLWPRGRRDLQFRVVISLVCLVLAIAATGAFPVFMGRVTKLLAQSPATIALGLAFTWIGAYVVARILMQALAQLRDGIFAKVQYHALREVGVKTFAHVHTLSLRFHLERKTGGLSRVIERGTKGIDTLLSFAIFSIFPTLFLLIVFSAEMLWTLKSRDHAGHACDGGPIYLVHLCHHALAHSVPPRHECERPGRQHQSRRQPAQLRNGQVFQQRIS